MTKLLIADDSSTVQKVIKLTLADIGVDLSFASNKQELFSNLQEGDFKLVLLDFALDEEEDGHALAKKIKEAEAKIKILAMLGTFDTPDEDSLRQAGVDDVVVKPFEPNVFVQKCKDLLDVNDTDGMNAWAIDAPDLVETSIELDRKVEEQKEEEINKVTAENTLDKEIMGWGMEIPSIIGSEEKQGEAILPSRVDEDTKTSFVDRRKNNTTDSSDDDLILHQSAPVDDDILFPTDNDLEYPDIKFKDMDEDEIETSESELPVFALDDLSIDKDSDNILSNTTQDSEDINFSINDQATALVEDISRPSPNLELAKAVEEDMNAEEFWAPETDKTNPETPTPNKSSLSEVEVGIAIDSLLASSVNVNAKQEKEDTALLNRVDIKENQDNAEESNLVVDNLVQDGHEIENDLVEKLRPVIEELVKKHVQRAVEKVAWDIIPDLAENLIREEMRNIEDRYKDLSDV